MTLESAPTPDVERFLGWIVDSLELPFEPDVQATLGGLGMDSFSLAETVILLEAHLPSDTWSRFEAAVSEDMVVSDLLAAFLAFGGRFDDRT